MVAKVAPCKCGMFLPIFPSIQWLFFPFSLPLHRFLRLPGRRANVWWFVYPSGTCQHSWECGALSQAHCPSGHLAFTAQGTSCIALVALHVTSFPLYGKQVTQEWQLSVSYGRREPPQGGVIPGVTADWVLSIGSHVHEPTVSREPHWSQGVKRWRGAPALA